MLNTKKSRLVHHYNGIVWKTQQKKLPLHRSHDFYPGSSGVREKHLHLFRFTRTVKNYSSSCSFCHCFVWVENNSFWVESLYSGSVWTLVSTLCNLLTLLLFTDLAFPSSCSSKNCSWLLQHRENSHGSTDNARGAKSLNCLLSPF